MYEIGRICLKIAGRDANNMCVVVDNIDDSTVLIDGQTRRKNCNVKHLEPTTKVVNLAKGASHEEVKKALKTLNIEVADKKSKKPSERPKKAKVSKEKVAKTAPKPVKATVSKKKSADEQTQ